MLGLRRECSFADFGSAAYIVDDFLHDASPGMRFTVLQCIKRARAQHRIAFAAALACVIFIPHPIFAADRVLSYQLLLDEIIAETGGAYHLTHAVIRHNPDTDRRFSSDGDGMGSTALDSALVIDKTVSLSDVRFEEEARFAHNRFLKKIHFETVAGDPWLTFDECEFLGDVEL